MSYSSQRLRDLVKPEGYLGMHNVIRTSDTVLRFWL